MWLGIGYTIPMRGDRNLHLPVTGPFIIAETGTNVILQTEDGSNLMVPETNP
jgi:hypothetical protein